ncbi:MAG: nucleotidyltransferase domain-containing protein [Deltaproteobacteria bacterium]|nr:nucleotidyltransferase domain-containing protein [Deltaproteobacteria bacterium]
MDLENIKQIISNWASGINYRIRVYLFGSRLKGTHRPDSDLDLAIEFLDSWHDTTLLWFDFHEQWQNELFELTGFKVDLQLYDLENDNIRAYIKGKSIIIFESPEEPEKLDTSSLMPPGILLNVELCDDQEE